jgi:hypothetical protein
MIEFKHDLDYIKDAGWAAPVWPHNPSRGSEGWLDCRVSNA